MCEEWLENEEDERETSLIIINQNGGREWIKEPFLVSTCVLIVTLEKEGAKVKAEIVTETNLNKRLFVKMSLIPKILQLN